MIKYFQNARDYISSFSHFLGVIMGIILMLAYIAKGIYDNSNLLTILGSIIFALSIILLYAASSFYHYIPKNSKHFLLFRKLDHSMIYILIAGSYTPVCLRFLEINHAITFLAIIWSIAFVGIILKFCWLNSPRILYTLLYLMMGWAVIFDFKSFAIIPSSCLLLITSDFTFTSFASTINKDLNDVLGNFVNRVLKMTASKIGTTVPEGGEWTNVEKDFIQSLKAKIDNYTKYLSEMEFRKALAELRAIWVEGNNYLTAAAPWTVIKSDKNKAEMILRLALNVIRLYAVLSAPVIPETSKRILNLLNVDPEDKKWPESNLEEELQKLKAGHAFNVPDQPLFQKITQQDIDDLCSRYGGNQEN